MAWTASAVSSSGYYGCIKCTKLAYEKIVKWIFIKIFYLSLILKHIDALLDILNYTY